jgi:hypothetical protein
VSPLLKSQPVRLLDVALVGPVMVLAGWDLRRSRPWLGWPLAVLGVATMLYNGVNYARYEAQEAR